MPNSKLTQTITIKTTSRDQFINITNQIQQFINDTQTQSGLATIFITHTTAAVTINENADPDVIHDILTHLDQMIPHDQPFFRHSEGNSAAHIKSSLIGPSITIPIQNARLQLGTWQSIYFTEFDGPRTRNVNIKITPTP